MREALIELFHSRELIHELSFRDLKIRYNQTLLGAAWAVLMPVLMMIIFTQIFARSTKIDTGSIPYPLFVFCGLLPWQYLSSALKNGVDSLTRNRLLVTKIYMPREVFPLSQVFSAAVDFAVGLCLLAILMLIYQCQPNGTILFLPIILFVQTLFIVGLVLLLSMCNLFYRDVKYVMEVGLLLWMFATSVVYPVQVDGILGIVLQLNPMTPIIDAYRQVLLHQQLPALYNFGYASIVSVLLFAGGLTLFHESEHLFAECI